MEREGCMKQLILKIVIFSLVLMGAFSALPAVAAPKNCEIVTHRLASDYWVTRLVNHPTQQVVDLQADWYDGFQTVHLAIDGVYYGEFEMPADFGGVLAVHELAFVQESGNDGRLKLKQRVIPVVKACASWSKIDNITLSDSAIQGKD